MNTPSSFIPDDASPKVPSTFVPDDDSSVVFQNRTPQDSLLRVDQRPIPQNPGDAAAMGMKGLDVGVSPTMGEVVGAPMQVLGQFVSTMLNQMADKTSPDIQQQGQFPNASHYRSGLQQRLFGPSNLRVLGQDPNYQPFHQGYSMLPMEKRIVGGNSSARQIAEGVTTPEGAASFALAPTKIGPALGAVMGAQTVADLPNMTKEQVAANLLMAGAPIALHGGFGRIMEAPGVESAKPLDLQDLQSTIAKNQISREGTPPPKEVPIAKTTNERAVLNDINKQPVEPSREDFGEFNDKAKYPLHRNAQGNGWVDDLGRPVDGTTHALVPEGGQQQGSGEKSTGPVSGGTLSPATSPAPVEFLGIQKGYKDIPDKELYNLTQDIEGHSKGSTLTRQDIERKGYSLPKKGEEGSVGLHLIDPEEWKGLGFKAKVGAEQFINRLRNKLGGESSAYKMIDTPEFRTFMESGPKTTEEVQKWVNDNGPRVEVRKLEASDDKSEARQRQVEFGNIMHQLDTNPINGLLRPGSESARRSFLNRIQGEGRQRWYPEVTDEQIKQVKRLHELAGEYHDFPPESKSNESATARYTMVNPKPLDKMPSAVDLLVRVPLGRDKSITTEHLPEGKTNQPKYTSSHYPTEGKNLLAHVRGYMETLPDGKKVFHVFEVQSDWAQTIRDEKQGPTTDRYQKVVEDKNDPLLQHYERLALKAAIEHARENGASAVAISDAETAMLTEWHDRQVEHTPSQGNFVSKKNAEIAAKDWQEATGYEVEVIPSEIKGQWTFRQKRTKIPQEQGMRLHYDRTLPKIAEELTGSKGQKVEFGRHQNTVKPEFQRSSVNDTEIIPHYTRDDLIFRNPDGTPKTSITARMYDISKAKEDLSILSKDKPTLTKVGNQGISSESGMINLDAIRDKLDEGIQGVKDIFSKDNLRAQVLRASGVSVPHTTAINKKVGNQLTMFAQAEGIAEAVARSKATDVLGDHWKDAEFRNKLGALVVEDQLRTLKAQYLKEGKTSEAQSVNTLVGQPYSPIKSEAQYQQLRGSKEYKAAIERHKEMIQPIAEQNQAKLGGKLRNPGQDTGAFVNLIAKVNEDSGKVFGRRQGDAMATLKQGTRFGKERKGTAAEYETDYRTIAERMVKGNWTEVEKQKLFNDVVSSGFGYLTKAGEKQPLAAKGFRAIPIQRRLAIIENKGAEPTVKSQNQTLWVPEKVAEEFTQAFQTDSPLKNTLLGKLGKGVTAVQTSLGADAAFHVGNMTAAVLTSPEKVTAVKLGLQNLARTFESNPEVQRKLAQMAQEAGIVREGETIDTKWKKLLPGKNMIQWFDQAGRLTLDELYQNAVKRGESPDDPVYRRAAVQGALGEYNKRLMSKYGQIFKESGVAPFLTAGKTFNKLSFRQIVMSPGRKATSVKGGATMRLRQALYGLGLVVATPMIINKMQTGTAFPPGVEPGQFVVKKNEDGSFVVEDIAQLLMMRRGLRNSGLQAVAQGIEDKQSLGQITKQASKDVGRGFVRPYAGPGVSAIDTTLGSDVLIDRPNEKLSKRVGKAAEGLNPTAEVFLNKDPNKTTGEKTISRFGRVIGLKVTQSSLSRINQLARQWKERNNVPVEDNGRGPYFDLTAALRKNDAEGARKALAELRPNKRDELIKEYYDGYASNPVTGSKESEKKFVGELSEEDKKMYQQVKDSNSKVRENFYNILLGRSAPRLAREGREQNQKRSKQVFPQ